MNVFLITARVLELGMENSQIGGAQRERKNGEVVERWFLVISEAGLCTFVMGSRNIIKVLAVAGLRDVLVPL